MKRITLILSFLTLCFAACNSRKTKFPERADFLSAKDAVLLNQLVYKLNVKDSFAKYAPGYEIVFLPAAVEGNLAVIAKNKTSDQYALVIRGSMIEFSKTGFQNFIIQDLNLFTIKKWEYADTVKEAYIGQGTWTGFKNLLQLKEDKTGQTIKEFIEQRIPPEASIVITGHSLGGNLAYPMAGYLKKELPANKKNNLQLITFGAPAAGNAAFVRDMEEKFPAAERYAIDKDIAPLFPDNDRLGEIIKVLGMDTVLKIKELSLGTGDLVNLAGDLLEKFNVVNRTNKYAQSRLHLRTLKTNDPGDTIPGLSADAIFARAYRFHRIDAYALLLGGKEIK